MLELNRTSALAIVLAGATLLTAVPTHAQPLTAPARQPSAKTSVLPAPAMTTNPGVKRTKDKTNKPTSVPAAGNATSGVFTIFGGPGTRANRTTITMPAASGTAVMGDWNGDGIQTPGRFAGGQWFTTDVAVDSPKWNLLTTFGGAEGDVPVVGLMDDDRISDVGVFNNGKWTWRLTGSAAPRTDDFGQPGDVPAVGDWNGDGRDELGVFRQGSWILRFEGVTKKPKVAKDAVVEMVPDAKAAVVTFPFGVASDVPVVGDWDGDGTDSPGIVRAGTTWFLSRGIAKLKKATALTIPVPVGSVPLVGSQATRFDHCPTASPNAEAAAMELAKLVSPPAKLVGTAVGRPGMPEIKATVEDSLRYVMVNDYTRRLKDDWPYPYFDVLDTHKTAEESVRRSANIAQAAAIMLSTTSWKNTQNISRAQLLAYTRWLLRSIACQHGSITPGGWGQQWQSALWAAAAGHAGWLIWDELAPQERAYIASMVAAEADAVSARGPKYYRNREGAELAPGNSKADEVSWDLVAPSLALAMMPTAKRAEKWRRTVVEFSIAAFARPSDLTNGTVVNGVNISQKLPGTNANEDGTITNHGIINPDYIQNVVHPWWGASLLRVARQPVPEAMFLNADIVYRALTVVNFPSPPYAAPGGIVYQPGGQIYYPQGVKWGARRPATFTGVDSFAAQYSAPDTHAAENLAAHARDTRGMQLRYKDGRIYASGTLEESYALGREEYALQQTALAWWAESLPTGPGLKLDKSKVNGVDLNSRGPDR